MKIDVRTVTVNNKIHIRSEDVSKMIRDFVSTEESDVRSRGELLANEIDRASAEMERAAR